jgi:phage/plasmid-like protein (TIGR03299 family)
MAHNVETMAYAGEVPWHGLGKEVIADLSPEQMLREAGIDWTVKKYPAMIVLNDDVKEIGRNALVRSSDNSILDVVTDDWNPVQNQEAFEFFNEYVNAGDMEMHTAGSLQEGRIVWGLAKVKESFELFKSDRIDSYLLFTNFHKYGFSTDIRFTPIRVVCNNTLTLSLNGKVDRMAKFSHRREFDPEQAKEVLGIATDKLQKYKEMAEFLGSKRAKGEHVVDYFKRLFPTNGAKDMSKNASTALSVVDSQPGAEYAQGTWWPVFNAVTYTTDHLMGRTQEGRITSSWYGPNKKLKTKALELAVEMAEAS